MHEQVEHLWVDVASHFEANRRAEASAQQFFFESDKKVFAFVIINIEIFVSRDSKRVLLNNLHTRKQLTQELADDFFELNIFGIVRRR